MLPPHLRQQRRDSVLHCNVLMFSLFTVLKSKAPCCKPAHVFPGLHDAVGDWRVEQPAVALLIWIRL